MLKKLALAGLICLFALPFVYLLSLSFATEWRYPNLLPAAWGISHWVDIAGSGGNWVSNAFTSLVLALLVAGLSTSAGFVTAWHLSGHPRRQLWLTLAYLPYVFSPVIYAHCLIFYFHSSSLSGTFAGVVLGQLILTYPFAFLLFFNHFDHNLRAMEALTYTLGGSAHTAFWKVLAPVSRPVLRLCFFQTFLISWFEYGLTSVIGLGQVRTLTVAVYQYIGEANQYVAALAGCLVCLPPLALMWRWRYANF
jgi:putative spermidine/putrescine transport system permease protein